MGVVHQWSWSSVGPFQVMNASWLVLGFFWIATWLSVKKTAKAEPFAQRLTHLALLCVGVYLFSATDLPFAFLHLRLYPDSLWIRWSGAAVTVFGVGFAIWARISLGRNWSAQVQIKEGHQLIRTGPYNYIRHPIYTGILLAVCGNAIALGEVRGALGFLVIALGFAKKARKEERFLASQFGAAFDEHVRHTGFFLPRFS
jgi:protein-S-isoprenylcysteine O-methyltransferase Ste14